MSLQDRQSAYHDVSARASLNSNAESIRYDLQKRIRFMKLQLEESQELVTELEGEKVSMEASLKSQKLLVAEEQAKYRALETEFLRIRETLEPARVMLNEERSSKKLIQDELQKSDAQVRALLLKEIDCRRILQEAEDNCQKRIAEVVMKSKSELSAAISEDEGRWKQKCGEEEIRWRRKLEEEDALWRQKNEMLSVQVEQLNAALALLTSEKRSLMEFWDRERDVLLKEQLLENDKMQDLIRAKDHAFELAIKTQESERLDRNQLHARESDNLTASLRVKEEELKALVLAHKSEISALKLKNEEQLSVLQQATAKSTAQNASELTHLQSERNRLSSRLKHVSAAARTIVPELGGLKKELLLQRQSCLQFFKRCQQDLSTIQSCQIELSHKSLAQAALHSKLERMFEAAADVACDASGLFAKAILAKEE